MFAVQNDQSKLYAFLVAGAVFYTGNIDMAAQFSEPNDAGALAHQCNGLTHCVVWVDGMKQKNFQDSQLTHAA